MYSLRCGPSRARRLKAVLSVPLVVLAVPLFLLEELFWHWLGPLTAAFARLAPVARIEAAIRRLPPYPAMALFLLPWLIILPVKLVALGLIATGHLINGALIFAAGELLGVGFLHRIYILCRPALLSLGWFIRLEQIVLKIRDWAHDHLERWQVWRLARDWTRRILGRLRDRLFSDRAGSLWQRFEAARRLVRIRLH